ALHWIQTHWMIRLLKQPNCSHLGSSIYFLDVSESFTKAIIQAASSRPIRTLLLARLTGWGVMLGSTSILAHISHSTAFLYWLKTFLGRCSREALLKGSCWAMTMSRLL